MGVAYYHHPYTASAATRTHEQKEVYGMAEEDYYAALSWLYELEGEARSAVNRHQTAIAPATTQVQQRLWVTLDETPLDVKTLELPRHLVASIILTWASRYTWSKTDQAQELGDFVRNLIGDYAWAVDEQTTTDPSPHEPRLGSTAHIHLRRTGA